MCPNHRPLTKQLATDVRPLDSFLARDAGVAGDDRVGCLAWGDVSQLVPLLPLDPEARQLFFVLLRRVLEAHEHAFDGEDWVAAVRPDV
jgi:hypothetical protein